jgi:hypothetical protein
MYLGLLESVFRAIVKRLRFGREFFAEERIVSRRRKLNPEKCQKEVFAPLPAIFLEGLPGVLSIRCLCGGVAERRGCSPNCQE